MPGTCGSVGPQQEKAGERDPEMHQTKKGNQWHFGMKVHIDLDKDTGLIHSMEITAANMHELIYTRAYLCATSPQ